MDTTLTASEIKQFQTAAVAAQAPAQDDLAFFQALWFGIPAALALWSVLIWGIARIV
jgi:hypothetical protein